MKKTLVLLIAMSMSGFAFAQEFTRKDSLRGGMRPERSCYDVHFYDLNIELNMADKSVGGVVTMGLKALADFNRIQVDLYENMNLLKVSYDGQTLVFNREFDAVFIDFPTNVMKGNLIEVEMEYSGIPQQAKNPPWDGGFAWKKDKLGNDWLGVAVEGDGASLWWPNKDHLSDEPDSMSIRVTVPDTMFCVSNGVLRDTVAIEGGKRRFDWFVSYPINNYNVTLNVGKYAYFNDVYVYEGDSLDLDYYVMPYNLDKAKEQFKQVHQMMDCFGELFGRYPFWNDGYCLVETPYLGMEHQGAIAYGNDYKPGYKGMRPKGIDFDYIIIHETGHEWWGNSVSMNDLADMWIHESFCTYSEALYVECTLGKEEMVRYLDYQRSNINNFSPVQGPYGVNHSGNHTDMYYKGSWMLHTLRSVVNDDEKWLAIIKGLALKFEITNVDRADIISYFEEATGLELDYFFDQYQKHTGIPELQYYVSKKWGKYTLHYKWQADVADFKMPVKVSVNGGEKEWLYPESEWKSTPISEGKSFKMEVDRYYFMAKSSKVDKSAFNK